MNTEQLLLFQIDLKLELTTLRKDVKTDGRHAEIEYTDDWKEDSNRRDFTINAIYLDITGNIFDPQLGSVKDLKNKVLKFIGDPQKRIEEDYLRIVRYLRFSLEYESETDHVTLEYKLNLNGIKNISKERILLELFKILKIKNFINLNNNKSLKEIFSLFFPNCYI